MCTFLRPWANVNPTTPAPMINTGLSLATMMDWTSRRKEKPLLLLPLPHPPAAFNVSDYQRRRAVSGCALFRKILDGRKLPTCTYVGYPCALCPSGPHKPEAAQPVFRSSVRWAQTRMFALVLFLRISCLSGHLGAAIRSRGASGVRAHSPRVLPSPGRSNAVVGSLD
jgi:hypothetical protein